MRIDMSGHQFIFPSFCACCGCPPDGQLNVSASKSTGKRVVHTKTQVWDFPYCVRCLSHVKAVEEAYNAASVLTVLSLICGGILWYFTTAFFGILIGIVGVVGTRIFRNKQTVRARSMCSATCVSVGKAVAYLGWHGTLHQFEVTSTNFAHEFMVANHRKLVNVTPQAHKLLASSGDVPDTNKSRAPRRFMT